MDLFNESSVLWYSFIHSKYHIENLLIQNLFHFQSYNFCLESQKNIIQFSSVQFSRSVVSDSLRPHELQHVRPPCPSPTPRVHSDSRPSSQWCHPAISYVLSLDACVLWCSVVSDSVTPWSVACQAPLSMEFSKQEYWSGLPFPSPGDLPNPGIKPRSSALQADSLPFEPSVRPVYSYIFIFYL